MLALGAIHRIHLRCIVFLLGGNTVGNNSFAVGIGPWPYWMIPMLSVAVP
nr:MAG TPA: hypothetical protein [Caudoviricetes sp.]